MQQYVKRLVRLVLGLFLFALGSAFSIQANIGLAPWDAFSMGLANVTPFSFGTITVLTGFVIILLDIVLREKIGFGTILNAILIGKFIDLILLVDIIPKMTAFLPGLAMLLTGQVILCVGSYYYIGAALGCGPRDALMVAMGKRFANTPIGLIRALIEGSALAAGWFLGAKVGLGTVIAVFGIGFILEYTFKLLHFDVKAVQHESINDTVKVLTTAQNHS